MMINCPVCKQPLQAIDYEGIAIHTCDGCNGEWLAADELKHIVRAREVRFSAEECRALTAVRPVKPVRLKDHDRHLSCPQCGTAMEVYNYAGDTGIVLDRCPSCRGVWMDAEELENVQRIVEGWELRVDDLPADLAKHGPRLKDIARQVDDEAKVDVSHFRFANALVQRILDVMWDRDIA